MLTTINRCWPRFITIIRCEPPSTTYHCWWVANSWHRTLHHYQIGQVIRITNRFKQWKTWHIHTFMLSCHLCRLWLKDSIGVWSAPLPCWKIPFHDGVPNSEWYALEDFQLKGCHAKKTAATSNVDGSWHIRFIMADDSEWTSAKHDEPLMVNGKMIFMVHNGY